MKFTLFNKCTGSLGLFGYMRWSEGSQINQVIMSALVMFPTFCMGLVLGWVSPALPQLQAADGPLGRPMSDEAVAWMASVTFLIATPVMLVGGLVADTIGRKKSMIIASSTIALCWLIKIIWLQSETIIFARAVSGIGNALSYVVGPIYTKEVSDDNIRGAMCSFLILAQNLGFVVIYIIGDMLPFKAVLWISLIIPVVHLVIFIHAPETPSFLVKKGKLEEATEVLAWLRCVDTNNKRVMEDINELVADDNMHTESDKSVFRYLLENKTAQKAFAICAISLFIQETCGYLILLTYASEVFEQANVGSSLTPNKQTIVLGTVQIMGSIVASCIVERTGRKKLLIVMSFLTGVGMLTLATCFYVGHVGQPAPGWLPICAMCLSIFCTAAGFQPIPFVLLAEMFNFKLRGLVTSICIAITALSDFIQAQAYEPVSCVIGAHGVFWIFSIISFAGTAFAVFLVPETKDKSLAEIYGAIDKRKGKDDVGEGRF